MSFLTPPRPVLTRQFSLKEQAILAHVGVAPGSPKASSIQILETFEEDCLATSPARILRAPDGSPCLVRDGAPPSDVKQHPDTSTLNILKPIENQPTTSNTSTPSKPPRTPTIAVQEEEVLTTPVPCGASSVSPFRGVPGSVKKHRECFEEKAKEVELTWKERWALMIAEAEREAGMLNGGKLVIYTTSMRAVQQTFSACQTLRRLLQNMRLEYEDRDVFLDSSYAEELDARAATVPAAFFNGLYLGVCTGLEPLTDVRQDDQVLTTWNEQGVLTEKLKGCPVLPENTSAECTRCGGAGFSLCSWCNGSKKSMSGRFGSLKCTACNANGLMKCTACH